MELRKQLRGAIDLLPEDILQAFYLIAKDYIEPKQDKKRDRASMFGCMKGKIWISDDFDEEMDEYGRFKSEPDFGMPVKEIWED